jgi:ABC-type nitrate/sulfonate/bicarbonate transport system permease component
MESDASRRAIAPLCSGRSVRWYRLVTAARTLQAVDMFVPLITISLLGLILNGLRQAARSYLLRGFPQA